MIYDNIIEIQNNHIYMGVPEFDNMIDDTNSDKNQKIVILKETEKKPSLELLKRTTEQLKKIIIREEEYQAAIAKFRTNKGTIKEYMIIYNYQRGPNGQDANIPLVIFQKILGLTHEEIYTKSGFKKIKNH